MSNKKQSSVEWFWNQIPEILPFTVDTITGMTLHRAYQQAKAMHKSEIIWAHGIKMKGVNNHKCVSGEQYYNETFGGNNEQQ